MNKLPDEILSEKIMSAIADKKIISKDRLEKYKESIYKGKMTPEDWSLLAEPDDKEIKDKGDAKKN
jgi:hypothetical protein